MARRPTTTDQPPADTGPQQRRTRSVEVRDALIDAAVRVLARDGLPGLTVRAVASEAGVAPMGVYNHLDGKDGLIVAVLERGFDGLREAITVAPGLDAMERLRQSGVGYRRFALTNSVTYELMFGGGMGPEIHERVAPHAEPALGALVDLVVQAQREGSLRPGDPMLLAVQIWSSVHGAVSLELAGAVAGETPPEEIYSGLVSALLRGLAAA